MPIKIPNKLPASEVLAAENIFVMDETRAIHQDIRPHAGHHSQPDADQDHHRDTIAASAEQYRPAGGGHLADGQHT